MQDCTEKDIVSFNITQTKRPVVPKFQCRCVYGSVIRVRIIVCSVYGAAPEFQCDLTFG